MAKDTTTYNFNGKKNLKKRNLVKEIIQKYIKDNPNIDYHQLKNIFNDKELKKKKIILDKNDYLDWKKDKKDKQDRYFPPIVLGNKEIFINNQWGVDNITKFIEMAKRKFNYEIEIVDNRGKIENTSEDNLNQSKKKRKFRL